MQTLTPARKVAVVGAASAAAPLAMKVASASSNLTTNINDSVDSFVPLIVTLALLAVGIGFLVAIKHKNG